MQFTRQQYQKLLDVIGLGRIVTVEEILIGANVIETLIRTTQGLFYVIGIPAESNNQSLPEPIYAKEYLGEKTGIIYRRWTVSGGKIRTSMAIHKFGTYFSVYASSSMIIATQ